MILTKNIGFLLLLCFFFAEANAQKKRPTAKELEAQALFVDANKSKMVGNFDLALERFEQVLARDKKNHVVMFEMAKLYAMQKDDQKAIRYIKSALEYDANNSWYNSMLADLYVQQNDYLGAAQIYDQLIQKDSENDDLYYEQAYLYAKAGKPSDAIKIYDQLEVKNGTNSEIFKQKYDILMRADQPKKALAELEKLNDNFPDNPNNLILLAQHYERMGAEEKASKIYKKILEIEPEHPTATLSLADLYQDQGETSKYLRSMQQVFSNPEVNIDLKIQEIVPYIQEVAQSDDPSLKAEATALTQLLIETHPTSAKAYSVHGDMLNYCDQPLNALKQYEQAVELERNAFIVWEQIFFINNALNQPKDLLKNTETALDFFPNQPTVYFFNGLALGQLKKHREALSSLEEGLMMVGKNNALKEQILIQMGVNYGYIGKSEKSDTAFEKALALNDKSPLALNNYAYHLALRGEGIDRAEEMVQQALKQAPNDPSIQDTLSWILYKKNKYKEAEKWSRKALANGADQNPNALENHGNILFQLGQEAEAIKYWEMAREKGANSPELDKKIEDRKLYE